MTSPSWLSVRVEVAWPYHNVVPPRNCPGDGVIVWLEKETIRGLVLKAAHDEGIHVLERALENDRIFRQSLEDRRDVLLEALAQQQCLVGLAPVLAQIGALPLTVYQLEMVLRDDL